VPESDLLYYFGVGEVKYIALLLIALQIIGCSTSYQFRSNSTARQRHYLNNSMRGLPGRMTDRNRTRYYGHDFQLGADSTSWLPGIRPDNDEVQQRVVMANLNLDSLVVTDKQGGARDGMFNGAIGGVLLSGLFIAAFRKNCPVTEGSGSKCSEEITFENVVVGVIAGVGFGAALGATIGASTGNQVRIYYEGHNPSEMKNESGVGK